MTDEEKVEWFNRNIKWVNDNGGAESLRDSAESCGDAPYDLFFDFLDQYDKCKKDKE